MNPILDAMAEQNWQTKLGKAPERHVTEQTLPMEQRTPILTDPMATDDMMHRQTHSYQSQSWV